MSGGLDTIYDVAVIGGGLSGLIAARKLLEAKPSLHVIVLEASDRIGGRIWTDDEGTELGAAFLGPSQHRMIALVEELGLIMYPIDTDGPQVMVRHGVRRVFSGNYPDFNWFVRLDVNNAICRIDDDVAKVPAGEPYLAPRARELDTLPFDDYLRSICWTEDAFCYLSTQLGTVQTTEPMHLSTLEALWFLRNVGSLTHMLVGETWKVKGGNSQIVHGVANALPHGTVRLSSPVRKIDTTHAEYVELRGLDFRVRAKRVVSAIPPFQLGRVEFAPPLPSTRVQELMHYPMGNVIKTFTYYSKRHWKPLNGRVLSVGAGVVANDIYDDSNPTSEEGVILGFIGADASGIYGDLKPEERCKLLAEQYAVALDCPAMRQPIRYKEKTFGSEPWVGGCFFGVPRAGTLTAYRRQWHQAYADGRVMFAGTEAADEWMAYMEGAYEAGERAARAVMKSLDIALPAVQDYDGPALRFFQAHGIDGSVPESYGNRRLPSPTQVLTAGVALTCVGVAAVGAWWLRCRGGSR